MPQRGAAGVAMSELRKPLELHVALLRLAEKLGEARKTITTLLSRGFTDAELASNRAPSPVREAIERVTQAFERISNEPETRGRQTIDTGKARELAKLGERLDEADSPVRPDRRDLQRLVILLADEVDRLRSIVSAQDDAAEALADKIDELRAAVG